MTHYQYPHHAYTQAVVSHRNWIGREAAIATAALEAEIAEDAREAADAWIDVLFAEAA